MSQLGKRKRDSDKKECVLKKRKQSKEKIFRAFEGEIPGVILSFLPNEGNGMFALKQLKECQVKINETKRILKSEKRAHQKRLEVAEQDIVFLNNEFSIKMNQLKKEWAKRLNFATKSKQKINTNEKMKEKKIKKQIGDLRLEMKQNAQVFNEWCEDNINHKEIIVCQSKSCKEILHSEAAVACPGCYDKFCSTCYSSTSCACCKKKLCKPCEKADDHDMAYKCSECDKFWCENCFEGLEDSFRCESCDQQHCLCVEEVCKHCREQRCRDCYRSYYECVLCIGSDKRKMALHRAGMYY